jgi:hypothetical protein
MDRAFAQKPVRLGSPRSRAELSPDHFKLDSCLYARKDNYAAARRPLNAFCCVLQAS